MRCAEGEVCGGCGRKEIQYWNARVEKEVREEACPASEWVGGGKRTQGRCGGVEGLADREERGR